MKNIYKLLFVAIIAFGYSSCEIEELSDPNGPDIIGFQENASKSALQTLVTGVEDLARKEVGFYYDVTSIIGREYYFLTGSDPRYSGELLGKESSTLDNAGFYGTRPFAGRYSTIKTANILIQSAENSLQINEEELNGYLGYAKTMQAYEYHLLLMLQYQNGIRIDVNDPDNLGPFVGYEESLSRIQDMLDDGLSHLNSAGSEFSFALSSGMSGFDNPSDFASFNRALAARIAIYQNDNSTALSALDNSFFDLNGDLSVGPEKFYSTAGGDITNQVFRAPNQAEAIIVQSSFITDAAEGDNRLSNVRLRDEAVTRDGLTGEYDAWVFKSLSDNIPYINNEELILIYAEANISSNPSEAVNALNVIRNAAGIGDYEGGNSVEELTDEMLRQRRYSLYGLGHRWVDMRRYDRLDELPIDRPGDDVWVQLPVPVSENQ